MLYQKYKLKVPSRWVVLALALRAIMNIRVLLRQTLYCCLFPSDYEFEKDKLVQLWMATGRLLKPREQLANNRFNRLTARKYILDSRTDNLTGMRKYKINARKVSTLKNRFKSKDCYALIEDENTGMDSSMSWNHVSIVSKSIDETMFKRLKGPSELRSVLLIRDYGSSLKQIPSSFFRALPYMQALDLSGSHISELPSSIGKMTDLHFLDLSYTLIERIPESIHLLKKLQTLKLKGCRHLHTLPKGMKELVNLYHLDFDVLGQLTSMPKGLGSLTKLRTLSAFIVSEVDGCSVRELKDMNNLCGSFCISGLEYATDQDAKEAAMQDKNHLTRLHLKWNHSKCYKDQNRQQAFSFLFTLEAPSSLAELQISNYPGLNLPLWIQKFKELVSVTFLNCGLDQLLLLGLLRHLNIYDMNRATLIVFRPHILETLTIDSMHSLEECLTCQVKKDGDDYQHLSKVSMKDCPKLPGLPFLSLLPSLTYLEISDCKSFKSLPEGKLSTSLETLIIDNCPLLKKRCSTGGDDWEKIKHVPNIWIDMKDIHSNHEETESLSEDESEYSDDSN